MQSYYIDISFYLAVNQWPFEVTEQGWGEFEIGLKVYFVDPNEKVLHLSHFLRLYPIEGLLQIRHPASKSTVITEQYDEIVRHIH